MRAGTAGPRGWKPAFAGLLALVAVAAASCSSTPTTSGARAGFGSVPATADPRSVPSGPPSSAPGAAGCSSAGLGGELRLLDAASGQQRWSADVGAVLGFELGPVPVLSVGDGVAVVAARDPSTATYHTVAVDLHDGHVRWRSEGSRQVGLGAPPVGDGVVLEPHQRDPAHTELVALDAMTGDTRWSRVDMATMDAVLVGSTAVIVDGRSGTGGAVVALDVATGQERWRADLDPPAYSVTEVDGALLARTGRPDGGGDLVALDDGTGAVRWRAHTGASPGPVAADDVLVLGQIDHPATPGLDQRRPAEVVAIDRRTGEIRWRHEVALDSVRRVGPVAGIRTSLADQTFVDVVSGSPRWTAPGPLTAVVGDLVVTFDAVDPGVATDGIAAWDASSGAPRWRYPVAGDEHVSGVVVAGDLLLASVGGMEVPTGPLVALDARSGEERWRTSRHHQRIGASAPVDDGILLVDSDPLPDCL